MAWEKLLTFGGYTLSQVDETYEQLQNSYGATNLVLGNVPSAITGPGDWTKTTGEGRWDVSSRLYVTTEFNRGWGVLNNRQAWGWSGLAYSGVAADFVWYINHEEEKADMFFICKLVGSWGTTTTPNSATETDRRNLYAELMRIAHVWTSVKTIRGKNGSFRLSDILNINEGEAVNDVPAAGNVNFTKKTKLDTLINRALETDGNPTKATVSFTLPNATYSFAKLVYKLGQMPEDEDDGVAIDITPDDSVAKIEDLEQDKSYWFAIFTNKTESNAVKYRTGEVSDEYYEFDYTGSIQTFTAPKTGYYQIETWGAQGGNATDGTNTARGGYGAYAVGEVLLTEGETIYINVGGQNGYGGGGNGLVEYDVKNIAKSLDETHVQSGGNISSLSQYWLSDYWLYYGWISLNKSIHYGNGMFYALKSDVSGSTSQNVQVWTAVPVNRITGIIKFKFKVRRTEEESQTVWNQLYIIFAQISNNSYVNKYVIDLNSPSGDGDIVLSTPNLNQWYEFEIDNLNIDYIDYVTFCRPFGGYEVKDMIFTCLT